jgi:hypothetical protein
MTTRLDRTCLSFGVTRPFDPEHAFVTSPFFGPLHLCIHRSLRATYTFTVVIISIIHAGIDETEDAWFTYFTHFSYIALTFYFIFAALHTYGYWRTGHSPLSRWPRPLQCLHSLLYTSITVFPPLMTIIFWTVMSDETTFATTYSIWLNISLHLINTCFVFTEVLTNSIPAQPYLHLIPLELCFLLYLPVVYITASSIGIYPFEFLNPDNPGLVVGAIFAGLAGIAGMFLLIQGMAYSKLYLLRSKGRSTGRLARKDPATYSMDLPIRTPSRNKNDVNIESHLA